MNRFLLWKCPINFLFLFVFPLSVLGPYKAHCYRKHQMPDRGPQCTDAGSPPGFYVLGGHGRSRRPWCQTGWGLEVRKVREGREGDRGERGLLVYWSISLDHGRKTVSFPWTFTRHCFHLRTARKPFGYKWLVLWHVKYQAEPRSQCLSFSCPLWRPWERGWKSLGYKVSYK